MLGSILKVERYALLLGAALGIMSIPPASSGAPAGATSCFGCHAPLVAGTLAVPSLEGRTAASIIADMKSFRSGERPSTVMGRIAKGFSEDETRAVAEWLAEYAYETSQP
jgi:sulfide dehydrogenase cytochrome subunit